ncbi:MAG: FKBP-type peptidyl-prolyl cis-trans isomerase [Longimicrobiales bacterium]|nr:FKBP-type peptidyl-prolyl cis-trans isomerase [Longimicrobiales bacterium]
MRRKIMMTARIGVALLGASVALAGCENAALDSDDQKASYGIGLNLGRQIIDTKERLDRAAFMRGVGDALDQNEQALSDEVLQPVLQAFGQQIQAAAAQSAAAQGTENAEAGAAYQTENAARDGVTTTASGLQYEVLRAGDGPMPTAEDDVRLHYRGSLIDGTEFDASYEGDPVVFNAGRLISGFTEALLLMNAGSHFRIVIPSEIAYGPNGSGPVIGPNSTLIFEIELFEVVE